MWKHRGQEERGGDDTADCWIRQVALCRPWSSVGFYVKHGGKGVKVLSRRHDEDLCSWFGSSMKGADVKAWRPARRH